MEDHSMHEQIAETAAACCPTAIDMGNGTHIMAGIPDWLYYSSIVIVMLISFLLLEIVRRRQDSAISYLKFELTRFKPVEAFFTSRRVQLFFQVALVALFGLILFAGFYGNQHPGKNIAPTLVWNIWWVGLIFIILFLGKMWCYACPWDAVTTWLRRLTFLKIRKTESFNLNIPWPKSLRNIYPAAIFFIALTWIELGWHVTMSPEKTAILGLLMFGLVFIPGLIFEKKSFCRYGCLVGRISGLYAMFSPIEIRKRDADVCNNCKSADCYRGNDNGYACPTGMNLKTMQTNTYCIMCAECFRTCPSNNVALNIRPFSQDLVASPKPRKDEAYLALILFALTAFHGLTMTPIWKTITGAIQEVVPVGDIGAFSIGMAASLILPVLVYAFFIWLTRLAARSDVATYKALFIKYAYGVVPIALFYHIAHNLEHFFVESQKLVVLISDPFGYGWDLFRTADVQVAAIFSMGTIWYMQVAAILIGHVFGIYVSHHHSHIIYENRGTAIRSQIPMIFLMICLSILSLWLIAQPMEMRTAM